VKPANNPGPQASGVRGRRQSRSCEKTIVPRASERITHKNLKVCKGYTYLKTSTQSLTSDLSHGVPSLSNRFHLDQNQMVFLFYRAQCPSPRTRFSTSGQTSSTKITESFIMLAVHPNYDEPAFRTSERIMYVPSTCARLRHNRLTCIMDSCQSSFESQLLTTRTDTLHALTDYPNEPAHFITLKEG
jgi:hypothetical protein